MGIGWHPLFASIYANNIQESIIAFFKQLMYLFTW